MCCHRKTGKAYSIHLDYTIRVEGVDNELFYFNLGGKVKHLSYLDNDDVGANLFMFHFHPLDPHTFHSCPMVFPLKMCFSVQEQHQS